MVLIPSEPVFTVYPYFLLPCIVFFMVFKDEVMLYKMSELTFAYIGKLLPSDRWICAKTQRHMTYTRKHKGGVNFTQFQLSVCISHCFFQLFAFLVSDKEISSKKKYIYRKSKLEPTPEYFHFRYRNTHTHCSVLIRVNERIVCGLEEGNECSALLKVIPVTHRMSAHSLKGPRLTHTHMTYM